MAMLRKLIFGFLMAGALGSPALAEKRVALVIGNSNYDETANLANPANDAELMAETFKTAGFDSVEIRRNLKIADMRRALRDFTVKSSDAAISVIYYAGHGIEVEGVNYLIPVDAVLDRDTDVYDEAVSLERVLVAVESAKKLRLVILDACRDNPFVRSMKRTLAARAIGRGLAKVEPTSPNTLIAFASKAGSTASDGEYGKNSPFATALVNYITQPGLDLRKAFGYVRDDVLKSTGNRQEPYLYGSLGGDDLSLVPAEPSATGPQADPQAAVRRDYELALQLATREGWEAFLSQYREGFYANLAKGQLKKIAAEEARIAAAEKARLAEQEKARLAAEGARQDEVAKAAAVVKAAEEGQMAAEKTRQMEQEKATAAEKARLAAQEKAAANEQTRIAPERESGEKKQQVAALDKPEQQTVYDLSRSLQAELRRVGCNTGSVDGDWNAASQRALELFNKHAGMKLDTKSASADALDAVKTTAGRICPLTCDAGYRADSNRCIRIVCRSGYALTDENTCEKVEIRPVAKRKRETPARTVETPVSTSALARADAAQRSGSYKPCMGALSGCYARAIKNMSPEHAQIWCSRRPSC
jgi:uncharacterized caspase-like protein